MRIAQESAALSRKKAVASKDPWLSPRPSTDIPRPRTSHSVRASSLGLSPSRDSLSTRRSDVDVSEHQALRFLALPSKVKRTHFTQEELVLLTESSERVLGWVALHDRLHGANLDRHGSVGSSRYFSSDSGDCVLDMDKDWFEAKTESLHSLEHADTDDVLNMPAHRREGSIVSTVDSSLSRPTTLSIQQPASRYNKSASRRRKSILAPLPLPPPTLLPAVPLLPSPTKQKSTEPGTETKYYKDTDARSKLREFLTSPAKFDEALEFGFPERRTLSNIDPSLQAGSDDLSVPRTGEGDDDDDDYLYGPRTPSVMAEGFSPGIVHHGSLDSGIALPGNFAHHRESIRCLSPDLEAGRSMTMKMTLTRSDLRAPEDKLYSMARMQVSGVDIAGTDALADPLALDPLPICDDHTGAKGAFAVPPRTSSGGFKKVWKNLRGL